MVERPVAMPEAAASQVLRSAQSGAPEAGSLGQSLGRKWRWIILAMAASAGLAMAAVNAITPRYQSEARILIDGRDNVILRPGKEGSETLAALDPEAVANHVQLLLSRDLAREIIRKNSLAERLEFDPVLEGVSRVKTVMALLGMGRDPFALTPEERVLNAYYERLNAYAVDKSRVIVIEFQSRDPELAARVANSIAESYLVVQQNARHDQIGSARQWLSREIDNVRKKAADADARVEEFRAKAIALAGSKGTISDQHVSDLSAQLNNARVLRSDAELKAQLIREALQSGKPVEASDLLSSELFRRLSEQRIALRGQLVRQSSTLLDGHPRIKELKAELADLDRQLRDEAGKISRSLDNDARIAASRVDRLSATLDQLKQQATSTDGQDVQLRALERDAKGQRELLESYLAKDREENTRENPDQVAYGSRIISRATISNAPAYPKKLPVVLIATLASLLLSVGAVAGGRWLHMSTSREERIFESTMEPMRVQAEPTLSEPALLLDQAPAPPHPEVPIETVAAISAELGELERVADGLCNADEKARKITILGSASGGSVTLTALTLARFMARQARVVLVDLSNSSPAVAAVSVDASAPGLAELILDKASFTEVITRDRLSQVHLINAGRPGFDRSLLQSPRLVHAVNALLKVYDHVLLEAGGASDLSVELLAAEAHAVVVPDSSMAPEARDAFCGHLKAVGFKGVTLLSKPVQAPDSLDPTAQAAA